MSSILRLSTGFYLAVVIVTNLYQKIKIKIKVLNNGQI
ncbi:unnamed protein product [Moritella viscosa]|uniref:Uncharacterized protein n=1 Tax=Moritella viscosa TaxID=80854 RepID=A0A1K9Z066_9GAMM|nr:unnamed protein product [Moritella viscosa]SGY96794.1 unnamed protein product [Moritella viscosa]SGY96929.1 unnamed protein product [Moritella viscosa]SHO04445.1 unnamed protein product [Moritella viscosa]SHO07362.1 unnamed protein product [Moritella viscosa]